MISLLQCSRKHLYRGKTLFRLLGQCRKYDTLNNGRHSRDSTTQWLWRSHHMLTRDLDKRTLEGPLPTQPFIGEDPQSILVTGRTRPPLKLLRSHVRDRTSHICRDLRRRTLGSQDQAKIAQ